MNFFKRLFKKKKKAAAPVVLIRYNRRGFIQVEPSPVNCFPDDRDASSTTESTIVPDNDSSDLFGSSEFPSLSNDDNSFSGFNGGDFGGSGAGNSWSDSPSSDSNDSSSYDSSTSSDSSSDSYSSND